MWPLVVKYVKGPPTAFATICKTCFDLFRAGTVSHLFNPPLTSRGAYLSTVNDYGDASCFVPGCLPQLFNPVAMPLRFQGSPALGVGCECQHSATAKYVINPTSPVPSPWLFLALCISSNLWISLIFFMQEGSICCSLGSLISKCCLHNLVAFKLCV